MDSESQDDSHFTNAGTLSNLHGLLMNKNMATIKTEIEYNAIMERIEELITLTDDDTPRYDKNMIEFDILGELAEEYEDIHYPIG